MYPRRGIKITISWNSFEIRVIFEAHVFEIMKGYQLLIRRMFAHQLLLQLVRKKSSNIFVYIGPSPKNGSTKRMLIVIKATGII